MREGSKMPIAAVVALLLAVGFAACGGGGSDSTATEAATTGAETTSSSHSGRGSSGESASKANPKPSEGSEHFVPRHHHDSGGGSKQFRVKGGDNSIQEFGSEAGRSERDRASVALHDFLDSRAAGDWAAACSYMASSLIESFEKLAAQAKSAQNRGCAGILKALTNPAAKQAMRAEAAQADVASLRIEGERAFVIYRGPESTVFAMPMAREGGAWKVASVAGTPLS